MIDGATQEKLNALARRADRILAMESEICEDREKLRDEVRALARADVSRTAIADHARISRRWLYVLLADN